LPFLLVTGSRGALLLSAFLPRLGPPNAGGPFLRAELAIIAARSTVRFPTFNISALLPGRFRQLANADLRHAPYSPAARCRVALPVHGRVGPWAPGETALARGWGLMCQSRPSRCALSSAESSCRDIAAKPCERPERPRLNGRVADRTSVSSGPLYSEDLQQQSSKHSDRPCYRGVNENRFACHKGSAAPHETNLRIMRL
jgi:hypothetical protein